MGGSPTRWWAEHIMVNVRPRALVADGEPGLDRVEHARSPGADGLGPIVLIITNPHVAGTGAKEFGVARSWWQAMVRVVAGAVVCAVAVCAVPGTAVGQEQERLSAGMPLRDAVAAMPVAPKDRDGYERTKSRGVLSIWI